MASVVCTVYTMVSQDVPAIKGDDGLSLTRWTD